MKGILIISLTVIITLGSEQLLAQGKKPVKIYLNNGAKINGAIVDSFDENFINIRLETQTEPIRLKYDHIKKIKFGSYGSANKALNEKIGYSQGLELKRFFHDVKLGGLFGDEYVNVSFQTVNGYQFNKFLGVGLGAGVNNFEYYTTVPVYASVKGFLMDKKISPFYFGDIGYGFAWDRDNNQDVMALENVHGGIYWQVGVGYQINFSSSAMAFYLGYLNQKVGADYAYYNWGVGNVDVSEERTLRPITFSVGFTF